MKHMEEIINMKNNEEPDSFLANLEEFEDQRVSNLDNSMTSEN